MTTKKASKLPTPTFTVPGLIEEFEEVDRPASTRQKYQTDDHIKALVEAAEKGRAFRLKVADQEGLLRKIHMHLRHAMRAKGFQFRFRTLGDQTMLVWGEKIKETMK